MVLWGLGVSDSACDYVHVRNAAPKERIATARNIKHDIHGLDQGGIRLLFLFGPSEVVLHNVRITAAATYDRWPNLLARD